VKATEIAVVILAAGQGTRMRSSMPKVMHAIASRPMFEHVLCAAERLTGGDPSRISAVFRPGMEKVAEKYAARARAVYQDKQLGTGHAVRVAAEAGLPSARVVLVLYADTPLISAQTLQSMADLVQGGAAACVAGFRLENPGAYGRLVAGEGNALTRIVEYKDASEAERAINLCNSGVMALKADGLTERLRALSADNAAGEYYLTDLVGAAADKGEPCAFVDADPEEFVGVNDRLELARAEYLFQQKQRASAMREGATLIAPDTVFFAADTRLGRDVIIEPHVFFGPGVSVADGAHIRAFSSLEGANVESGATVGPYARLRPGARIGKRAKIGNFVEVKNAAVGEGAKVNHLSYIGDATVGAGANIGAGAITCNYDGAKKSRTEIGENAFIGSDVSLVAPVKIGAGARIAAGSVITEDVSDNSLAIARNRQVEKKDYYKA